MSRFPRRGGRAGLGASCALVLSALTLMSSSGGSAVAAGAGAPSAVTAIRTSLAFASGAAREPAVAWPHGAVGIVPPTDPPANCTGGSSGADAMVAIDFCRGQEGVGPLVLPSNFNALTVPEQLFVVADLERVNRGEPPAVGLSSSLDGYAQGGADAGTDPDFPPGGCCAGGSIWASTASAVESDFLWMYDDGPGGTNLDCTPTDLSGCWGHRDIILFGPSEADVIAGAATGSNGDTMEFLGGYGTTDLVFTWAAELPFFATAPTVEPLAPPVVSGVSPATGSAAGGELVTVTGSGLSAVTAIDFGSTPSPWVTCTSDSSCSVQVPPGTPGRVTVTARSPGGVSTSSPGSFFTYGSRPVCSRSLPSGTVVGMATSADGDGYWLASSTGLVSACGDATVLGDAPPSSSPVVAIAGAPDGGGYWLATADGQVAAFGTAVDHGQLPGTTVLNRAIVAMATDPATGGYWLLGGDGGVFSFDAPFLGSTGNLRLNAPAVGMIASGNGTGYLFVATDGGVFAYGKSGYFGSMGGKPLNRPVVGIASDPATGGYWLDASDGGIFAFHAPFFGSTGSIVLNRPCVGMTSMPGGGGYRFVAADGGIFAFGSAPFEGSAVA